jgi:hypothetical protein
MAHGHSKADLRNWHVHRAALENLQRHPERLPSVLALLENWLRDESLGHARAWLDQWRELLTVRPFAEMRALVLDPERGQLLRQCSPLGPALTPQERWRALEEAGSVAAPPGRTTVSP